MSANRLTIVDRQALTEFLSAIEAQYGSQNKAAKAIGIGQATFSRLQNATTDELDLGTFRQLVEWCGGTVDASGRPRRPFGFTLEDGSKRRRAEEEAAIEAPVATEQEAASWWTDEEEVKRRVELYDHLERSVLGEGGSLALRHYESWLREERERLRQALRGVPDFDGLKRDVIRGGKYRRVFESFANKVGRDSPYPDEGDIRYWLAVYRAIEPFTAAEATWGVERGWREMHDAGDLAQYLDLGLRREAVLMDREPDLKRVSAIEPPVTESEYLAKNLRPWEED